MNNLSVNPSTDQMISMIKWAATMFAGYAVNRGYMSSDLAEVAIGAVVAVALLGVGIWQHTTTQKMKSVAAINPGIAIIVPEQASASNPSLSAVVQNPAIPQVMTGEVGKVAMTKQESVVKNRS